MQKLGVAFQWVLIKLKVLKSDGTKNSRGIYVTSGLNKYNPLSYVVLVILAIPVLTYGISMAIKDSFVQLYETLIED